MGLRVDADRTRSDIRDMFYKWGIDNFSISREQEEYVGGRIKRGEGVTVSYFKKGQWQRVFCNHSDYSENLRSIFLFLDRVRIAEKSGIAYQGLSSTKDIVASTYQNTGTDEKEALDDAYDVVGVKREDPDDLVDSIYKRKAQFFHPDKGGTNEQFSRLDAAYKLIMKSRGKG
jgi:hypothetical protein